MQWFSHFCIHQNYLEGSLQHTDGKGWHAPGFSTAVAQHWTQEVVFLMICICYSNGIMVPSASLLICINYPVSDSEPWESVVYNYFCYQIDHCQGSTENMQTSLIILDRKTNVFFQIIWRHQWMTPGMSSWNETYLHYCIISRHIVSHID